MMSILQESNIVGEQSSYQGSDTMWKLSPILEQLNSQNCLKNMQETLKRRLAMLNKTKCCYIILIHPTLYRNIFFNHADTSWIRKNKDAFRISTKACLLD